MCTVSVKVDENVLREFLPELEETETISIEEAREMTLKAVREEYSKE